MKKSHEWMMIATDPCKRCFPRLTAWFVLTCCLSTGCQSTNKKFYTIGIYGVHSTNDFPLIRNAFFNVVVGSSDKPFLDAAEANGLKVLASPGGNVVGNFNSWKARRVVEESDSHPTLWAWYLVDEPDLQRLHPRQVKEVHRLLKSIPARKPTALVIFNGNNAVHYAGIADIMMIDRYPIPWLPLGDFDDHVKLTRFALPQKKRLISVVQAFNWEYHKQQLPNEADLRQPTRTELRCMTYLALLNRSSGIFYAVFDFDKWKTQNHSKDWETLKEVVFEVNERLPLFKAEHIWWIEDVKFIDYPARLNEKQNLAVDFARLRVHKGNHRVLKGDYILAVNTSAKSQQISFAVQFHQNSSLNVFEEDRWLTTDNGWFSDEFEPFAVHIYGPVQ